MLGGEIFLQTKDQASFGRGELNGVRRGDFGAANFVVLRRHF